MNIPNHLKKVRDVKHTKEDLILFEEKVKKHYEDALISAPVHLSKGNEEQVMKIFQYVHES